MLIPVKSDISLIYECPKCKWEHWLTKDEAEVDGFIIVCCGTAYKIKSIQKVGLNIQWKESKPIPKLKSKQPIARFVNTTSKLDLSENTISTMVGLGYDRGRAIELINEAMPETKRQNELLKNALAKDV